MQDIKVYVTDENLNVIPVCGYIEWQPETEHDAFELVNSLKKLGIVRKHGLIIHVET